MKALFYVVANIVLGIWYFWQGYRFLVRSSFHERVIRKQNKSRILLTQTSLMNSVMMVLLGISVIFVPQRNIYGCPWGYFSVWGCLLLLVQLSSLIEILLFGGVVIEVQKTVRLIRHAYWAHSSVAIVDN